MKSNKYNQRDIDQWCQMYKNGMTLETISSMTNVPKSTVRFYLKKTMTLRPAQQKDRVPWNKGKKTGQIVWNKGLSGNYPYASPNKGKRSKFKNVPRSEAIKNTISLALRKLDWNGYGYYENYKTRKDSLYLIILTFNDKKVVKVGRSFFALKKRYVGSNYEVLKQWSGPHEKVYKLEQKFLITFQNYISFGPTNFVGRTECFSINSPIDQFIAFIKENFLHMAISSQAEGTLSDGSETTGEV